MEEEGEEERGGTTVWRKRVRGERGGTTVWRKRERGRGVVPPCGGRGRGGEGRLLGISEITTCLIGAAWVREEEVQHLLDHQLL